jgi:histidinol-phosphate aminotransferase
MTRLTRADLDGLPNYVPGRNLADLVRELGISQAIKLASNEVPYGPLPGVTEAVVEAMRESHRYPDLAKATCLPGDEIVYSWRSFEAYPIITAGVGATSVRVANTAGHGHNLSAMADAITDQTRLVIVCNPNNPTGTSVRKPQLDRFLASVPSDVLVLLDEAYRELVTDPDVPDALETYADRPNVVVLRTMSKAWGLAGLRMGYLVAQPEVATAIRKVLTPFSTSVVAQAAALAALRQEDEVRRRCALVVAERDRVTEALRKLSLDVPSSQANFVWLPLGDRSAAFGSFCESRGVIVRAFHPDGVRVTIGTPSENDQFLAAAETALDQTA